LKGFLENDGKVKRPHT